MRATRRRCCHRPTSTSQLRIELESIASSWRGGQPERGFVMALDGLFSLGDENAVFMIGRDRDGTPQGFLHFAIVHAGSALSLSSMPRVRATTPNGFNEWLICEALLWAREHDYRRVSLNFSPFAALLGGDVPLSLGRELQRRALLATKGPLPARQPARVQPEVLPRLGAPVPRLRAAHRPAAGRDRRPRRRGVPPVPDSPPMSPSRAPAGARVGPGAQLGLLRPARRHRLAADAHRPASAPTRSGCCSRTGAGSPASSPASGAGRCTSARSAWRRSRSCRPSRPAGSASSPCSCGSRRRTRGRQPVGRTRVLAAAGRRAAAARGRRVAGRIRNRSRGGGRLDEVRRPRGRGARGLRRRSLRDRRRGDEGDRRLAGPALRPGRPRSARARVRLAAARVPARERSRDGRARDAAHERAPDRRRHGALPRTDSFGRARGRPPDRVRARGRRRCAARSRHPYPAGFAAC